MNKSSKYKLLIFDLDDTLFDYQSTDIYSVKSACIEIGIPYNEVDTYALYKKASTKAKSIHSKLITEIDFKSFRVERANLFLNSVGCEHIEPISFVQSQLKFSEYGFLIDGVYLTLQQINKSITKVVGTNGSTYPRINKINNSTINCYIDGFYSSESLGVQKPDASFFKKIISNYNGISNSEVLVIGNNLETDILGASDANINSCFFNYLGVGITTIPKNTVIIKNFPELINLI